MIKRKLTQWISVIAVVALVGIGGYSLLPQIMADTFYPLEHTDYINDASSRFGIDPALVAALIYGESHFNEKAISRAGAMGLGQLMPATAEGMYKRYASGAIKELAGVDLAHDFWDAKTNIYLTTAYLAGLAGEFDGDITAALIAYNGGSGAARRYLAARDSSVLVTETRLYAPKILGAYDVYKSMYRDQLPYTGKNMLTGAVDGPQMVNVEVQKPSDKINSFWKGFMKDIFAKYVKV